MEGRACSIAILAAILLCYYSGIQVCQAQMWGDWGPGSWGDQGGGGNTGWLPSTYSPPADSTPTGTSTTSQGGTSSEDYLDLHNKARSDVGVGAMAWDKTVAGYAQDYANQLAGGSCSMVHSGGQYGENLFGGSSGDYGASDAVGYWVAEKENYDYDSNTCSSGNCAHYTQIVWRDSVRLGCGQAVCSGGSVIIVCSYDPPGNYNGQRPY